MADCKDSSKDIQRSKYQDYRPNGDSERPFSDSV